MVAKGKWSEKDPTFRHGTKERERERGTEEKVRRKTMLPTVQPDSEAKLQQVNANTCMYEIYVRNICTKYIDVVAWMDGWVHSQMLQNLLPAAIQYGCRYL